MAPGIHNHVCVDGAMRISMCKVVAVLRTRHPRRTLLLHTLHIERILLTLFS